MRVRALFAGCGAVAGLASAVACTGPNRVYVNATSSASGTGGHSASSSGGPSSATSTSASGSSTGGASTSSTSVSASSTGVSSSASTSTSSGAGGATGCSAGDSCVEAAPTNWAGPYLFFQGPSSGSPPPCPSGYTSAATYTGSLQEGTPVCDCACGAATGITCTNPSRICYPGSGMQSCNIVCNGGTTMPVSTCTAVSGNGASTHMDVSDPAPTAVGSCVASPTKTIPTPTWGTVAQICSPNAAPSTCAGGVCASDGSGQYTSTCVVASGDVACPDAFYATQYTFYDTFTDTRDCSTCSCGTAVSKCGGGISFQASPSNGPCATSNVFGYGEVAAGTCSTYTSGFDSGTYVPSPSGTCPPSTVQVTGMVTPNQATTVCCH